MLSIKRSDIVFNGIFNRKNPLQSWAPQHRQEAYRWWLCAHQLMASIKPSTIKMTLTVLGQKFCNKRIWRNALPKFFFHGEKPASQNHATRQNANNATNNKGNAFSPAFDWLTKSFTTGVTVSWISKVRLMSSSTVTTPLIRLANLTAWVAFFFVSGFRQIIWQHLD